MKPIRQREKGYVLLAILLMLMLLMVAAVAVAPRVAQQLRRDREEELIHRGTQYARAVRKFFKKVGRYPNSLDELENTNHIRFLRRRYKDPITGQTDWRVIHLGEAKIKPRGFFGQALQGASNPASSAGNVGTPAANLSTGTQPGNPGTPAANLSSSPGGKTFGGGPIVGVASSSTKESIKEINEMNHYNDWEFVYDPRMENPLQQQQGRPNANPNQPGGAANGAPPPGQSYPPK